ELWEQMNTCSCLNLILACIVYSQAWEISQVLRKIKAHEHGLWKSAQRGVHPFLGGGISDTGPLRFAEHFHVDDRAFYEQVNLLGQQFGIYRAGGGGEFVEIAQHLLLVFRSHFVDGVFEITEFGRRPAEGTAVVILVAKPFL